MHFLTFLGSGEELGRLGQSFGEGSPKSDFTRTFFTRLEPVNQPKHIYTRLGFFLGSQFCASPHSSKTYKMALHALVRARNIMTAPRDMLAFEVLDGERKKTSCARGGPLSASGTSGASLSS